MAVAQGKGFTHEEAKVAALGETIEAWYAEQFEGPVFLSRCDDLRHRGRVADPGLMPLSKDSPFSPYDAIPWVLAEDLLQEDSLWIPFELVHANVTVPRLPGSGNFIASTNGLASGNSLLEATFVALCEVIERDAHAIWRARARRGARRTRIIPESVDEPRCRELLDRFERADIDVMMWDITSDLDVPAFRVLLYDRWADSPLSPYPAALGAAAHLDPPTALAKALLEAAQSRLTSIAGARDDMTRASYRLTQSRESRQRYGWLSRESATVRFRSIPTPPVHGVPQAVERLLDRLRERGIQSAGRVHVSPPDAPLAAVRVVVPGLEGPSSSPSYVPGSRARNAKRSTGRSKRR